jgi:hypothetical protein
MNDRLPSELVALLELNPFRHPNRYVPWHKQELLSETTCKKCGTILTAMGPDPRFKPLSRELLATKTRTIIQTTMVSRLRTNAYDTIEFEVEEPVTPFQAEGGETREELEPQLGLHRTTICTPCKELLLDGSADLLEVQWLYEADLERMAKEDEVNQVPASQTLEVIRRLAARRVTRVIG